MPGEERDLTIRISADGTQAAATFSGLQKNTDNVAQGFTGMNQASATFFAAANVGFQYAAQYAEKLLKVMVDTVKGAVEEEQSILLLKVAMENAAGGSQELFNQILLLSDELARMSGFTNDEVRGAFLNLIKTTGDVQVSMKAMEPVINMAIMNHMSLERAAQLIGRAYETGGSVLRRYGIILDDHAKGMEVINAIEQKFGNTMKENADTTDHYGKKNAEVWKEFADLVGSAFLNNLKDLYSKLTDIGQSLIYLYKSAQDNPVFQWLGKQLDYFIHVSIPAAIEGVSIFTQSFFTGGLVKGWKDYVENVKRLEKDYETNLQKHADESKRIMEFKKKGGILGPTEEEGQIELSAQMKISAKIIALYKQHGVDIVKLAEKKRQEIYAEEVASGADREKVQKETDKKYNQWVMTQNNLETKAASDQAKRVLAIEQAKLTQFLEMKAKYGEAVAVINQNLNSEEVQGFQAGMQGLTALSSSKNETLFNIAKNATMAMIPVQTAQTAMNIYQGFSTIPIIGPVLGIAGAAAAIAYGAERLVEASAQNYVAPASAASGIYNSGGINGEPLITTLDYGEAVLSRDQTEAAKNGSFGGGDIHVHLHGGIVGVDSNDVVNKITQKMRSMIQSGTLNKNRALGATS